ncbi:hypothetical protein [Mycolicibacterium monacense]|uniref:hypothetical protein n=1 Tax=Mycolicibacterium monacense TaxID=85693 RepID=UPI0013D4E534|nr:hypothetical protein [Mycolicibacterium monacense]
MTPVQIPTVPFPAPGDRTGASTPVAVVSCSRIGLRANPPRPSLVDWLLPSRRR